MKQTNTFYEKEAKRLHEIIKTMDDKIRLHFPQLHAGLVAQIEAKTVRINNQMAERREKKFRRDEMDIRRSTRFSKEVKRKLDTVLKEIILEETNNNQNLNESLVEAADHDEIRHEPETHTMEELTEGVDVPSKEPILLTSNPKYQEQAFKDLLSKDPSFVPTPRGANWDQLHQELERFSNHLRKEIFFYNNQQDQDQPITDVPQ